ncbi:hypothetical protein [Sediminibacter sp. Hel_I_10]|uniref:hypothetical protein n=1 Tax=Sediminibacter sp. Hel_I_10 TaxID=1392490 RepID=UPI00055B8509|nr:hypothetical protein [Sediminibacter sp. Hel_I_10]
MKTQLLVLVILALMSSCSVKKKTVERQSIVSTLKSEAFKTRVSSEEINFKKKSAKKVKSIELLENEIVEIEADSTSNVTVLTEKTENGYKKTFTGVKNLKISNSKSSKVSEENEIEAVDQNIKKADSLSTGEQLKIDQELNSRETNTWISRIPTWFWILLLIIATYMVLRKRVGFLP